MGKNSNTRKGSFLKRNKIAIFFLCCLFAYLLITIINQEIKLRDLKKEEARLQQRVEELKKEASEIEIKTQESTSLESIEKIAREKLKMVKQNEIIYIIQDEKESD